LREGAKEEDAPAGWRSGPRTSPSSSETFIVHR
jgi:hypothetical protein